MAKFCGFRMVDGKWNVQSYEAEVKKKAEKKDLEKTIGFLKSYSEFCQRDEEHRRKNDVLCIDY